MVQIVERNMVENCKSVPTTSKSEPWGLFDRSTRYFAHGFLNEAGLDPTKACLLLGIPVWIYIQCHAGSYRFGHAWLKYPWTMSTPLCFTVNIRVFRELLTRDHYNPLFGQVNSYRQTSRIILPPGFSRCSIRMFHSVSRAWCSWWKS